MSNDQKVVIAVMGVTGSGKSTFVKRVTGDPTIVIGHSLRAETTTTTGYEVGYKGMTYLIANCPGFNDTYRDDEEILEDIVAWLANSHGEGALLSAVPYLHRITDTRVQGTTMTQFRVLEKLCGPEFYDNLVLGTTFWGNVSEEESKARETELATMENFFGDMRALGAKSTRIMDDRQSCLELLEDMSRNQRRELHVQREVVSGKKFQNTAAERFLIEKVSDRKVRRYINQKMVLKIAVKNWTSCCPWAENLYQQNEFGNGRDSKLERLDIRRASKLGSFHG